MDHQRKLENSLVSQIQIVRVKTALMDTVETKRSFVGIFTVMLGRVVKLVPKIVVIVGLKTENLVITIVSV